MAIPWLDDDTPLPPTSAALGPGTEAPGLLAAGGGLAPARLTEAYGRGVFPWYSPGQPVLWWSPDPRMVLRTADFKLHPSLRKTLRRFLRTPGCEVRFDHDTPAVMRACAATPRAGQNGTWIVPEMQQAYTAWAAGPAGPVHSISTWVDGRCLGGLYGVNLGRMMFGESMFSHATDMSKIALCALVAFCRRHGMPLIDCQQETAHLASVGARHMPRAVFEAALTAAREQAPAPAWVYDPQIWQTLPGVTGPAAPPMP